VKNRIIILVVSLLVAAGSLTIAAHWQHRLAGVLQKPEIDDTCYLVMTWTIAFIIAAVATVWTAFDLCLYWKRRDDYDDDGYLLE
jgi:hypothetical protein